MGSNTSWKVRGPRETSTAKTKDFGKSSIVLEKSWVMSSLAPFVWGPGSTRNSSLAADICKFLSMAHDGQLYEFQLNHKKQHFKNPF